MYRPITIAASAFLAACSPASSAIADQGGSSWTFVSIDGKAPVASRTSLVIEKDRISASAGCNSIGGRLKVNPGRLIVSDLISTEMFCEKLMEQERAITELLSAGPGFFIENGRMGIVSGKHRAELVRAD